MDPSTLPQFIPGGEYRIEMIVTRKVGDDFKILYTLDCDTLVIKD